MRQDKAFVQLECQLTDEERLRYSKQLAENIAKQQRVEEALVSYKSQAKAEVDGCKAQIALLSDKINTGREYREIECAIEYDWDNGVRRWIRSDTGEIAKEDMIPESDRQEHMKLGGN